MTRCVNTVLLVTSPPVTLPSSLVGPTRTAPIWVSRPWGGALPRWTASVPLRTRQPCWSALITTLCATMVRWSGPRSWQGYVGVALERDLARMRWCFLDKTPIVNSFISETDWIISDISLLGARGISSVRFTSRFHTFPNSRMSEHQHRGGAQGWMACFRHCCQNDPWWVTWVTGLANRTQKRHCTQDKHKNVPEFLDPQKPQEHTHTDVQTPAHDATAFTTTQTHHPSGTLTCPQTLIVYLRTT